MRKKTAKFLTSGQLFVASLTRTKHTIGIYDYNMLCVRSSQSISNYHHGDNSKEMKCEKD